MSQNNGYGTSGWWDYEPDQLWRLPPAHVCPLSTAEMELLDAGFYPASLYERAEPPENLPSDNPWQVRDHGAGVTAAFRGDHYGYSDGDGVQQDA